MLVTFILLACGEDSTTEKIVEVAAERTTVVADVSELPKCEKDNEGEQVFVTGEESLRICADGKWFATLGSADAADFACTTKELKDKSGIKIICNGDSIGVVLNGSDGKNGKAGVNCEIKDKTDSAVTLACGDSTITIDLGDRNDIMGNDSSKLDSEKVALSMDSLTGYSQKGPFLKGSTVYLYELSDGRTLKQTNGNFTSNIMSDNGRYKFNARNLVSQYAMVVVDGHYRNEVTGENSNTSIKLKALTDMTLRKSANVNLLTHLEFERVYYLVTKKKMKVWAAKRQAQAEILDLFHVDTTGLKGFSSAEDLDVFGKSDADAILLAISILLQGDRSEADMMALLSEISNAMAEDGKWDGSRADTVRASIADWALKADEDKRLEDFSNNVSKWGLSKTVPDFKKYIRRFAGIESGLGVCEDSVPVGTVKNVANELSENRADTYWDKTHAGKEKRFVCDGDGGKWLVATDLEKDRYGFKMTTVPEDTKDGKLLEGPLTGKTLVWDKDTLRYADSVEIAWGKGCVSDMYGNLFEMPNRLKYSCDASGWSKTGTFTDSRDGNLYKAVQIGNQIWMAENLNYNVDGSHCYEEYREAYKSAAPADSCKKYGRYYSWALTVGKSEAECGYDAECGLPSGQGVQGVCPEGWHVPSHDEWMELLQYADVGPSEFMDTVAVMKLKSTEGWGNKYGGVYGNGNDDYGFTVLPAGSWSFYYESDNVTKHYDLDQQYDDATFWTSTEFYKYSSFRVTLNVKRMFDEYSLTDTYISLLNVDEDDKSIGRSVRCIRD